MSLLLRSIVCQLIMKCTCVDVHVHSYMYSTLVVYSAVVSMTVHF